MTDSAPGPLGPPVVPPPVLPKYAGRPRLHPGEIPLLVTVIVCTVLAYAGAVALVATGETNPYLLLFVAAPVVIWFVRGQTWALPRVNGVQMTPTQFPEGYRMVVEAAQRFGMPKVPDAYVVLGNGMINAYASGHGFRRFVVVYSDLFEIGGEARDPDALAFIVGHEVGHIAAGHTSYWRVLGMVTGGYLPVIGPALSRAQEYTADNHGFFNSGGGAPRAMGVLAAGKYMLRRVGFDELADRATTDKGFFAWLANLGAGHPVLTWRTAAVRNRWEAGRLFFRPKRLMRAPGLSGPPDPGPVGPPLQTPATSPAPADPPTL